MKKIISKELEKVKELVGDFSENTTNIFISRSKEILNSFAKVGEVYLLEISDTVLKPSANSNLASNWNQGKIPKNKIYVAELIEILSDMYKWNGVAINDQTDNWFGWIPKQGFKLLERR